MAEPTDTRVAVYIDFDNIVISRYDQRSKRGQFHKDEVRKFDPADAPDSDIARKLDDATVDLGAVLDFASSFGTIAVSRAYADWSVPVNASYRRQLIERAVDLVQLFPTVQSMKNGADIRLAVDVVEDLFRLSDLTHVVIVAGDSDYIALAQRCKQLGRYVVGIGVAGATSKALAAACNEFKDYDALPGLSQPSSPPPTKKQQPVVHTATDLLVRALQLGQSKTDDEWQSSGTVKNQMLRMDPTFQERALGFRSFSDFVKSLDSLVELDESQSSRPMRLRGKG
jgi:uncharacterized LabA/DUF88 family protein